MPHVYEGVCSDKAGPRGGGARNKHTKIPKLEIYHSAPGRERAHGQRADETQHRSQAFAVSGVLKYKIRAVNSAPKHPARWITQKVHPRHLEHDRSRNLYRASSPLSCCSKTIETDGAGPRRLHWPHAARIARARTHETDLGPFHLEVELRLLLSLRLLSAFPQVRIVEVLPVSCVSNGFGVGRGKQPEETQVRGAKRRDFSFYFVPAMLLVRYLYPVEVSRHAALAMIYHATTRCQFRRTLSRIGTICQPRERSETQDRGNASNNRVGWPMAFMWRMQ